MAFPKLVQIRQTFSRPLVDDVPGAVLDELERLKIANQLAGKRIGITAGSRGIQNIVTILRYIAQYVKQHGGEPFLLAAMGSHGGGTEAGQKEVLDSLGLTKEAIGAQVLTCAESEIIGHTRDGIPTFILQSALSLDGILVVNRVKTHTSFKGKVESGLVKKLVVGLGGPQGAQQFHGFGSEELSRLLIEIGEVILEKLPIVGGIAIIENAYEETALIKGVTKAELIQAESQLLLYSKSLMPSLPIDDIDVLIIGEMGKNFSGTGIDTNIIGRTRIQGVPEPLRPAVKRIVVLDLSEESHGNATGIGLADFVTQRLVDKMDRQASYLNCLTSTFVIRAAIPIHYEDDQKLLEAVQYSLSSIPAEKLRVVVIPNTLFLTECLVSEGIAAELSSRDGINIAGEAGDLAFDPQNRLLLKFH
ncbi:DUF362 domain-containing protein [Sporomusa malonica]|uniref:Uncharacterized protein n=1 Tax=Sporomusa malonica TaxID=112901 RepID=A0A1W2CMC4_9FIRM|nr:DUF362 domain-containing protein [Sporomusa malonica]SMC86369.1 protein of unknown function [Sporomusa malonica]